MISKFNGLAHQGYFKYDHPISTPPYLCVEKTKGIGSILLYILIPGLIRNYVRRSEIPESKSQKKDIINARSIFHSLLLLLLLLLYMAMKMKVTFTDHLNSNGFLKVKFKTHLIKTHAVSPGRPNYEVMQLYYLYIKLIGIS